MTVKINMTETLIQIGIKILKEKENVIHPLYFFNRAFSKHEREQRIRKL